MTGSTKKRTFSATSCDPSTSYTPNSAVAFPRPSPRASRYNIVVPAVASFPSLYIDHGNCALACEFCNALFWHEERCVSLSLQGMPKYTQCCRGGRVTLPDQRRPSPALIALFQQQDFLINIRAYNSMFSMTSFGAKIDNDINSGTGPYVFKIEGQIHHWLGGLCPPLNEKPRFLQMYIYDTENELSNRLGTFTTDGNSRLNHDVVQFLMNYLQETNALVQLFTTSKELCTSSDVPEFCIRLFSSVDAQSYDKPSPGTIGAIIPDDDPTGTGFDIIIRQRSDGPQRISKLHPTYMSLQYPLLFVYGESGWSPNMHLRVPQSVKDKRLTMNMYYTYILHDREARYTHLLRGGRLLQQFIVDAYVCIEQNRLDYVRQNQGKLRFEFLQGVHDAIQQGDSEGKSIGRRMILPASFIGGPRYMYKHYLDALAICRVHGNPQYFITFTCNVRWPEIQRFMLHFPTLKPEDRPDIIARVFQMKVRSLLSFLKSRKPFGEVAAGNTSHYLHTKSKFLSLTDKQLFRADLYTIEFQKRGLPHCHLLLWVVESCKIKSPQDVNTYISAEIPNPEASPELYRIVTDLMIHGPCGLLRPTSPCMVDGSCKKNFPKQYQEDTFFDANGYVHYKRCSSGFSANKGGLIVDNRYVVPYNATLLLHFAAHINVEYCGWNMLIKYLFKYISKGADRIHYKIKRSTTNHESTEQNEPVVDEIKNYVDSRFICPHEASWRIHNFLIHDRNPPVQTLSVHLENMQNVFFKDNEQLENVANNNHATQTTLTEWLDNNTTDPSGRHLTYIDYLKQYRWEGTSKKWVPRTSNKTPAIGRLIYIHPTCGETFYLRLLLDHQKGCQSFASLRTVNNKVCSTYRDACEQLGLLENDQEWSYAINEAAHWATASQMRSLFTHMLLYCEVSNPSKLWNEHWAKMRDDITYHEAIINSEDEIQYVLYELELLLHLNFPGKSLSDYGLPTPNSRLIQLLKNKLVMEEKNYDRQELSREHEKSCLMLNAQQLAIYQYVTTNIEMKNQVLGFVYGHGGTGKTFLWSTIISALRSKGSIVLAVASSGIASLLLPSGRTAHSRFKIPLDISNESLCNIKKKTHLAQLIAETSLIVWDEAPMNDRKCFEALSKSLQDVLDNTKQPFGGISVLLGGDFRQTLPVIPKATKSSIIASALPNSYLWQYFKVFRLTENMRLQQPNLSIQEKDSIAEFSTWLLDLGDGKVGEPDKDDPINTKWVNIPNKYIIPYRSTALEQLIAFIYDDTTLSNPSASTLSKKAIVCPKNDIAQEINLQVLRKCPGVCKIYNSVDSIVPHTRDRGDTELLYPPEYLNMLNFTGLPPHSLELKVNAPIMLLRNLNPTAGLCNGTRLIVTQLLPRIIEAQIITGTMIGQRVYIPRIILTHADKELPFVFKRKQFPVKLCYAMTINKSQGQSLDKIGMMHFKPLSAIRASHPAEPIQIRVLKKWIPHNQSVDMCYFFVDEQGDAIHVSCLLEDKPYFDSLISVGSCYIVDKYVPMPQQKNMPACAHEASLELGRKATFNLIQNNRIPRHYYRFASYDDLPEREKSHMLTDYIGIIEDDGFKPTKKGPLRKIAIRDERQNVIDMAIWRKQEALLPQKIKHGDIWAFTGILVTTFNTILQFESTTATTIDINPTTPETAAHVERLRHMPVTTPVKIITPIAEIQNKTAEELAIQNRFTCRATIDSIRQDRPWFYVSCFKCGRRMLKKDGTAATYECRDDDGSPRFQYCVNTKIKDKTAEVEAIFFDEAMTGMIEVACNDMVLKLGQDDPYAFPDKILNAINAPKIMSLTAKPNNPVAINSVSPNDQSTKTFPLQPTADISTPPIRPPTTPAKRLHGADKAKQA